MKLERLMLQNVGPYREAQLDLSYGGLTYICGSSDSGRTNMVGKTLLFCPLQAFIADSYVFDTVKTLARSSYCAAPDSRIELWADSKGAAQYRKGQSIRYDFYDGEWLEPRTKASGLELIQSTFRQSPQQFYCWTYLNSGRQLPIQYGSPVQNYNYFCDLIGLNQYDLLAERTNTALKELKNDMLLLEQAKKVIEPYAPSLSLREAQQALNVATEKYDTQQRLHKKYTQFKAVEPQIKLGSLYKRKLHRSLLKLRDAALEYAEYTKQLKQYNLDVQEYNKNLKAVKGTTLQDLRKQLASALKSNERLMLLREQYEDNKQQMKAYSLAHKEIIRLKKRLKSVKTLDVDIESLEQQVDTIESVLEHYEGTCPVCGSNNNPRTHLKAIKKTLEQALALAEQEQVYVETRTRIAHLSRIKPVEPMEKPKGVLIDISHTEHLISIWESLDKPVEPKRVKTAVFSDKHRQRLKVQERAYQFKDIKLVTVERPKSNLKQLMSAVGTAKVQLENVRREWAQYKVDLRAYEVAQDTIKRLSGTSDIINGLTVFSQALGAKGLKVSNAMSIAESVEASLNDLAGTIFGAGTSFRLTVEQNSLTLAASKKQRVMLPHTFSGAETRAFSLLWALATMPYRPPNAPDVIILDEYESGLDETGKRLLRDEYLPELLNHVKGVYMITPFAPQYHGNRVITVVNKKGHSILEEQCK